MSDEHAIPPEEAKGFFARFTQNHVAATLLALAFIVAGAAALLTGRVRREVFPEITPNVLRFTQAPWPTDGPPAPALAVAFLRALESQRLRKCLEVLPGLTSNLRSARRAVVSLPRNSSAAWASRRSIWRAGSTWRP